MVTKTPNIQKGEKPMKYQSKKDPEVFAAFDMANEKYNTTRLIYLTGEDAGKSFDVSNSTLKRWWKKVEDENVESEESILNIDMEQVNEPYNPKVTPHYIPKPQSVIEYEEKKKNKKFNNDLPKFEEITDTFGEFLSKINETSQYIKFKDGTTLWRKSGWIDIYATESVFTKLAEAGLQSSPNKDKVRPFAFRLSNSDEYEKAKGVLANGENEETV